ncbi:MAG: SUMF1/EgtB/PvdO family nonheme iron enzyme [Burkholderiales bacterium]|nr:SUMF1/EgtB/PvdO family nonheme iron enzyme [Burkholderiales bacterium]
MKIFLSYASEDRAVAEPINLALLAQGHDVFFDRDDLAPGAEYDNRVRRAIARAHLLVFLVSAKSVQPQRYTLSELGFAQRRWKHPDGRVLPVLIEPVALAQVPAYLRSVTLLDAQGNVTAEVADAVHRLAVRRTRRIRRRVLAGAVALVLLGSGAQRLLRPDATGEVRHADGSIGVPIAQGRYTLGDDEYAPMREVSLGAFRIDRHEITTAQYAKFLQATGHAHQPEYWSESLAAQPLPVIGVSWHDARAYCAWAGRRLPTEAEWEAAARGRDARRYPWGGDEPDARRARLARSADEPYQGVAAVGSHPAGASPAGVHDLAGNAAEWVADWYAEGIDPAASRNPTGPAAGTDRIIRGGGYYDAADRLLGTRRFHASPSHRGEDIGFRCAADMR